MAVNFLTSLITNYLHIQEAQKALRKIHTKRSTNRHIIVKTLKVKSKEKILKVAGEMYSSVTEKPQ